MDRKPRHVAVIGHEYNDQHAHALELYDRDGL